MRALALGVLTLVALVVAVRGATSAAEPDASRHAAVVELGRRLFFDAAVSRTGMRSCADCHDPRHGYGDPAPRSRDDRGLTQRHAQTLIDGADNPSAHWDGEFRRVEDLVLARLTLSPGRGPSSGHGALAAPGSYGGGGGGGGGAYRRRGESDAPVSGESGAQPVPDPGAYGGDGENASGGSDMGACPPYVREGGEPDAPAPSAAEGPVAPARDPFAELAYGSTPEPGVDFVAADVDITGLPLPHHVLRRSGRYAEAFQDAFGSRTVTLPRIAEAVGAYCRSIRSSTSAYDRHVAGDPTALSASARRGFALFRESCAACHTLDGERARFTDYATHDTGVAWRARNAAAEDLGAARVTTRPRDLRAFKTPTLRDVAGRAPYFHDGSARTLADAVRHYLAAPADDPALDARMPTRRGGEAEVQDLVAFLESLSSDVRPGLATNAWSRRAPRTRLSFVDADGAPLSGLRVRLEPAGDGLPAMPGAPADEPRDLVTDAAGRLEVAPFAATHARVLLEGGLEPDGGCLVPDTCREAVLRVPVRGTTRLLVTFRLGAAVPEALVVEHPRASFRARGRTPRTLLRRESLTATTGGRPQALYSAPLRTDVPPSAVLRLPVPTWGLDRLTLVLTADGTRTLDLSR
jgi:cytochrome c peroxidase